MASQLEISTSEESSRLVRATSSNSVPSVSTSSIRPGVATVLLALGILVHILFIVSLKTGWLSFLFNDSAHRFGAGGDFFSIYAAGTHALHGNSVFQNAGPVGVVPYAYPFRYAPIVAYTLATALNILPAIRAYSLWIFLCELALLRNIRLTLERAPDRSYGCLGAAMWLLFTPYFLEIFVGQFTFVTASLLFWAYLAWQKRAEKGTETEKASSAGDLLWGGAFWLKMMPLLFLPVVLLRGRWKGALIAIFGLLATSAFYFHRFPADWRLFLATNVDGHPFWHAGNQGLMAFLYAATQGNMSRYLLGRAVLLCLCGLGLFWLIFVAWKTGAKAAQSEVAEKTANGTALFEKAMLYLYAACSALHPLLYKDVWEHHYILLLPPLVLLALRKERVALWLPPFLLCALPTLFAFYDVNSLGINDDPQGYWMQSISLLHHAQKPLAPLWLLSGLLISSLPLGLAPVRWQQWQEWKQRRLLSRSFGWVRASALMTSCVLLLGLVRWAGAAIHAQKALIRQQVVPFAMAQQQRRETCGPAALLAICRHYGVAATEEELARLSGTDAVGTSMLGLQQAAHAKRMPADGWQVSLANLARVPRPCILFFRPRHFVVLYGVNGDAFYIADPSLGLLVRHGAELTQQWKGEVLVLGPPDYTSAP
jgi:hypothetical protein